MLSEEEKQAIELLNTFKFRQKTLNYNKICLEDVKNVEIITNLIEKLQKEKEEYRINWCNKGEEVERLKK